MRVYNREWRIQLGLTGANEVYALFSRVCNVESWDLVNCNPTVSYSVTLAITISSFLCAYIIGLYKIGTANWALLQRIIFLLRGNDLLSLTSCHPRTVMLGWNLYDDLLFKLAKAAGRLGNRPWIRISTELAGHTGGSPVVQAHKHSFTTLKSYMWCRCNVKV